MASDDTRGTVPRHRRGRNPCRNPCRDTGLLQGSGPTSRLRLPFRLPDAMDRHPIEARIDPHRGGEETGPGVEPEAFREALSHWASTVTVVAIRDGDDVHATTVTSFFPVSADPPLVAVSLGPNAQVLPWIEPGARLVVSLLAEGQSRLASTFADSFPVGPSPFPEDGDPVVAGAVAALACTVREVLPTGADARLVLARVESTGEGVGTGPLLYHRRSYRRLAPDG